jgi:hypothetical protein
VPKICVWASHMCFYLNCSTTATTTLTSAFMSSIKRWTAKNKQTSTVIRQ